jgi:hypothetical protein
LESSNRAFATVNLDIDPTIVRQCGTNAALVFALLSKRSRALTDSERSFTYPQRVIKAEIGLGAEAQNNAIRSLCGAELLAVELKGTPRSTHYRVTPETDRKAVGTWWELPGFVYLLAEADQSAHYKIGYSKDVVRRVDELREEWPQILLLSYWPGTRRDEQTLHVLCKSTRVRGEWFALTDSQFRSITDYFESGGLE